MARNIISREFIMTKVKVYTFEEETMTVQAHDTALKGVFDDKLKLEKAVSKLEQFRNAKVVKVEITGKETKMLGMTVEDFIKYAVELDENRKIKDESEDVTNE